MAVPETTETRCRDGSVQAKQVVVDTTFFNNVVAIER